MTGEDLAEAARNLVGTRFRLHGRTPNTGLDCLGLVGAAFAGCGQPISLPSGYTLRSLRRPDADPAAASLGFQAVNGPRHPGDLLMLRPAAWQFHFALATGPLDVVHAHAGLGRVVEGPLPDAWPIAGHWRLCVVDPAQT